MGATRTAHVLPTPQGPARTAGLWRDVRTSGFRDDSRIAPTIAVRRASSHRASRGSDSPELELHASPPRQHATRSRHVASRSCRAAVESDHLSACRRAAVSQYRRQTRQGIRGYASTTRSSAHRSSSARPRLLLPQVFRQPGRRPTTCSLRTSCGGARARGDEATASRGEAEPLSKDCDVRPRDCVP